MESSFSVLKSAIPAVTVLELPGKSRAKLAKNLEI